ncbi:MAG: potassium-transporting ATPase subunit KdpC [Acidiphilium sp.]
MIREIRSALSVVLVATLMLGVLLPMGFTELAQFIAPFQANGSLLTIKGRVIGSALIGQNFAGHSIDAARWFQPRPSALTGTIAQGQTMPTPYDASESGGSNAGPTNKMMIDHVRARIAAYRAAYGSGPVPDDAVTSSGSGLDPDISLANALRQAPSVAQARHLPINLVRHLVQHSATHRWLGVIGTPHVNVLKLNLALTELNAR